MVKQGEYMSTYQLQITSIQDHNRCENNLVILEDVPKQDIRFIVEVIKLFQTSNLFWLKDDMSYQGKILLDHIQQLLKKYPDLTEEEKEYWIFNNPEDVDAGVLIDVIHERFFDYPRSKYSYDGYTCKQYDSHSVLLINDVEDVTEDFE